MSEKKSVPQREKMFDPAFQKSFTEAIHKENKALLIDIIIFWICGRIQLHAANFSANVVDG